jgi:hypothetical protein
LKVRLAADLTPRLSTGRPKPSPLRGPKFLTKRVTSELAAGVRQHIISDGDLDAPALELMRDKGALATELSRKARVPWVNRSISGDLLEDLPSSPRTSRTDSR